MRVKKVGQVSIGAIANIKCTRTNSKPDPGRGAIAEPSEVG